MSLLDRLAATFRAHRRQWLSGRLLAQIGGYGGFRTRISELRRWRGWQIDCDVRSVKRKDGSHASVSFYRLMRGR